jgi:hypothetical protein
VTEQEQLAWDILSTPNNADFKEYRKTHSASWLTKDRKILLIKYMETSYIINCINMLEALGQQDTLAYKGLIEELRERGGHYDSI